MQFTIPTTKEQMYVVLDEIFNYYRIQREEYQDPDLGELNLERLEFSPLDNDRLKEKAAVFLADQQEREINDLIADITAKITAAERIITSAEKSAAEQISQIEELYEESKIKLQKIASKNGLINSVAYLDKLTSLENQRILRTSQITENKDNAIAEQSAIIAQLTERLSGAENYYSSVHQKAILAKTQQLADDQDKLVREIFKYNNGLDEKEQRYKNTIYQARANLKLKYMEITVAEFSKDQLVEMGYYQDVVDCVCGYYDTVDALSAYKDITADTKLPIYLDDYYQNIVYMYGVRSGAIS